MCNKHHYVPVQIPGVVRLDIWLGFGVTKTDRWNSLWIRMRHTIIWQLMDIFWLFVLHNIWLSNDINMIAGCHGICSLVLDQLLLDQILYYKENECHTNYPIWGNNNSEEISLEEDSKYTSWKQLYNYHEIFFPGISWQIHLMEWVFVSPSPLCLTSIKTIIYYVVRLWLQTFLSMRGIDSLCANVIFHSSAKVLQFCTIYYVYSTFRRTICVCWVHWLVTSISVHVCFDG